MRKYSEGNLSLGTARLGGSVVCVCIPDIGIWERAFPLQAFYKPIVGRVYTIRANVVSGIRIGILLVELHNPKVSLSGMSGEPFFPYHAFDLR